MQDIAYPLQDPTVDEHIARWIEEAGGRIPLPELVKKFVNRFAFKPGFVVGEEELRIYRRTGRRFKYAKGMVSL